ncbi:hypothetical protein AMAG_12530 [Allomyces macrogynus ATCC 38327]|uniref:SPRY domain-containing protein n=1 Tax=Allomyces macrogynus (strain ATCC 38327) TaxID=578462 RepID=A0A0L0SZN0_ALLM3|nr:hypothetical protein AMAG_12530 [Allomyces macrogynus ATCC 38327]|eukprot:KNE67809.1 hypothetical protein AMAG_12530 [Allomyces macrogynus ATCC 38327]
MDSAAKTAAAHASRKSLVIGAVAAAAVLSSAAVAVHGLYAKKRAKSRFPIKTLFEGTLSLTDANFILTVMSHVDPHASCSKEDLDRAIKLCADLPVSGDDVKQLIKLAESSDVGFRRIACALVRGLSERDPPVDDLPGEILAHILQKFAAEEDDIVRILYARIVINYVNLAPNIAQAMVEVQAFVEALVNSFAGYESLDPNVLLGAWGALVTVCNKGKKSKPFFAAGLHKVLAKILTAADVPTKVIDYAATALLCLIQISTDDDWIHHMEDMDEYRPWDAVVSLLKSKDANIANAGFMLLGLCFNHSYHMDAFEANDKFLDQFFNCYQRQFDTTFPAAMNSVAWGSEKLAQRMIEEGFVYRLLQSTAVQNDPVALREFFGWLTIFPNTPEVRRELQRAGMFDLAYQQTQPHILPWKFLNQFETDRAALNAMVVAHVQMQFEDVKDDVARNLDVMPMVYEHLIMNGLRDPSVATSLLDQGHILQLAQRIFASPKGNDQLDVSRAIGALALAAPDTIPHLIEAVYEPMLARAHTLVAEIAAGMRDAIAKNKRGESVPEAALDVLAKQSNRAVAQWMALVHHMPPAVLSALWAGNEEEEEGTTRQTITEVLELCTGILQLLLHDSEGRVFPMIRLSDVLEAYTADKGLRYSDAQSEFAANRALTNRGDWIVDVLTVPYKVAVSLIHYNETKPAIIDQLPLLALVASMNSYESLARDSCLMILHAPPDVARKYRDFSTLRLSLNMNLPSNEYEPHKIVRREFTQRCAVFGPGKDRVHWEKVSGNVETGQRGNLILNQSHCFNSAVGSLGVTGSGKYGYTIKSTNDRGIYLGWATRDFTVEPGRIVGCDEHSYSVSFVMSQLLHNGRYQQVDEAQGDNEVTQVLLDLDNGTISACIRGKKPRIVFRNIDTSKVWYPAVSCGPVHAIATDFEADLPGVYMPLAAAWKVTSVPLYARSTGELVPKDDRVAPMVPFKSPVPHESISGIPTLPLLYYEASVVPSELVGVGIEQSGVALLWVGTRDLEMIVTFPSPDPVTCQEWTKYVPLLAKKLLQGAECPNRTVVNLVPSGGNPDSTDPDDWSMEFKNRTSEGQILLYNWARASHISTRSGSATPPHVDLRPAASHAITVGIGYGNAPDEDDNGGDGPDPILFVTKELQLMAEDRFWLIRLSKGPIAPLVLGAKEGSSITLNVLDMATPLIQGKSLFKAQVEEWGFSL